MNRPAILFPAAAALVLALTGCARNGSIPHKGADPRESRFEIYLASLRVGMTVETAEQELNRMGCIPIGTIGIATSHRQAYLFVPDAATVTLQYDEQDRLVSWKGAEGQKTP